MSTINQTLVDQVVSHYRRHFGVNPQWIARAPGRVNLLGEHVDYNDGFVMPAAIDQATYVAFSRSIESHSHIVAFDLEDEIQFSTTSIKTREDVNGRPLTEWSLYPAGVAQVLNGEGLTVSPINAVFASDVPRGSGLSSSASVEVAFLTAWKQAGEWALGKMESAKLCQKAEIEYVGVNCGIMDQFASVCGEENKILSLDCRSLEWESFELPGSVSIVIADTTVRRKLTSGGYNTRHDECDIALRLINQTSPEIQSFRDVSLPDLERYSQAIPAVIAKRARHVVSEIDRTIRAQALLKKGDIQAFGRLINETHVSLRDDYEVSCPQLDIMVSIAQSLDGCLGARLTGAGFGGCTVNLVQSEKSETFIDNLTQEYKARTNLDPAVYLTHASQGAEILE